MLAAQTGIGKHPVVDELFKVEGAVHRSLGRSHPARADFCRNVQQVEIRNQAGIILGYRTAFSLDVSRFSRSIEKIVRGLFYRKAGFALLAGYRVEVVRGNSFWVDDGFQNLLRDMHPWSGYSDGVFLMRSVRDRSDPNSTAWLLLFYRTLAVFAWTEWDSTADDCGNQKEFELDGLSHV
jgi:hypothetical protein